ncbi:tyrosine-type recombinase/integrase [Cognatishimia activa]|uniref:Site-specific integrase n=1 Tax=Cognatishimia activa TaxID=1715691 RepID=A0A975I7P8_9RHOB|nr:site-specific integrase [Cognatishimia activa]QTN36237.1 site-specific integrase [Cognatishimia activa]
MYETPSTRMRLYNDKSERLYINADERERFLEALNSESDDIRAFCLTLFYTGCRLSEARELRFSSIQPKARLISFRSLKKRNQHHIREIPVPQELIEALDKLPRHLGQPIWTVDGQKVSRVSAYRWVKRVMVKADIHGPQATAKGLRHGYGIHAVRSGVQLNMLQKWMGHASISTTAIYANAVGREELEIADRMW